MVIVKIIGITGQSGSGKSYFSKVLLNDYNSPFYPIQMDWFFKEPRKELLETPDAVDSDLFISEIKKLKENLENGLIYNKINISIGIIDLELNPFNFKKELYIIIEGFLLFYWKEISDLCDIRYVMRCPYEICRDRRYFRDYKDIEKEEYFIEHKKQFDKWYENTVYKYYLLYIQTQIQNLNNNFKKIY
jgi:uridine kinase